MPIKFNVNSTNYNTPIMTEFLRGLLRAERPNFPSLRESARMSGQNAIIVLLLNYMCSPTARTLGEG